MKPVFVDVDVLICAEDGAHPRKQAAALAWMEMLWRERAGRISTEGLNEFYVALTTKHKPPMPQGDTRAKLRRYNAWNPWRIDQATVETAWAVEARHGLSYWDCLVIASAQHSGCAVVLSESMEHDARYGAVRVVNPHRLAPENLMVEEEGT